MLPAVPISNGEAELAVRTLKGILKKTYASNQDMYLGLLAYRSTPLSNGYSPCQLLMGRNLRTPVPALPFRLYPRLPNAKKLRRREKIYRTKNKAYKDRGSRSLESFRSGDSVYSKFDKKKYEVIGHHSTPRNYVMKGTDG